MLGCRHLVVCLLALPVLVGCREIEQRQVDRATGTECLIAPPELRDAARERVRDVRVAGARGERDAERVGVEVCRTAADRATAEVTVVRLRDDSVRDVRHGLALEFEAGAWRITRDVQTRLCQPGRGSQELSGRPCT